MDGGSKRRIGLAPTLVASLILLVIWQIAAVVIGQDIILVTPWQVLVALVQYLPQPGFWARAAHSLIRIGGGFVLGFILGVLTAWLSSLNRWLAALTGTTMRLIRSIPVVCFIILLLIWADSTYLGLTVSFLMVLPVVYANTEEGFTTRDPKLAQMAQVFQFSPQRRWWAITLPHLMPYLIPACRVGIGLAWKAGISAEVIGMPSGSIGERLYQAKIMLSTADLFAWTVVIVALSYLGEKLALWSFGRLRVGLGRYGS